MTTLIFLILGATVLLAAAAVMVPGVMARIRQEACWTVPAASWLDVWLPLIAAAPFLAAVILTRDGEPEARFAVWWAVAPTVAFVGLAVALALGSSARDALDGAAGLSMRHAIPLLLVGAIITIASLWGRLGLQHGLVLSVAGVTWLWVSSPAAPDRRETGDSPRDKSHKPLFLLDWAGQLSHPVPSAVKLTILGLLVTCIICFALGLRQQMALAVIVAVAFQAILAVLIRCRLGPASMARFAASTAVISILFGLGTMAVTRLGGRAFTNWLGGVYYEWVPFEWYLTGPTLLQGVSSLRMAGVFLLGLGLIAMLQHDPEPRPDSTGSNAIDRNAHPRRFRSLSTALVIAAASLVVAGTGSATFVEVAGDRVSAWIIDLVDMAMPATLEEDNSADRPGG